MRDLTYPWTPKPITGNILEEFKKRAKPNCNKCWGRGHVGYEDVKVVNKQTSEKLTGKRYIACRCVNKNK